MLISVFVSPCRRRAPTEDAARIQILTNRTPGRRFGSRRTTKWNNCQPQASRNGREDRAERMI